MYFDGSSEYSFGKFTTHFQELLRFIAYYWVSVFQTPKRNSGSTVTFGNKTFIVQEKGSNVV